MTIPSLVPEDYESVILDIAASGGKTSDFSSALGLTDNQSRAYLFLLRNEGKIYLKRVRVARGAPSYRWYKIRERDVPSARRVISGNPEKYWASVLSRSAYA